MTSMPSLAALPTPTVMATGVASPSAHGQEMTSTLAAYTTASPGPLPGTNSQTRNTMSAMPMTTGTKMPLILSARRPTGALDADAFSTAVIMRDSVVSSPTRSARTRRYPLSSIHEPMTSPPVSTSRGMLSPVMAASLTEPSPPMTVPSAEMLSPALTMNTSPAFRSARGIIFSSPFSSILAREGRRPISPSIADVVRFLDSDSRNLPTVTSASIIADESKYMKR